MKSVHNCISHHIKSAGIATGFWTLDDLREKWRIDQSFHGTLTPEEIDSRKHYWLTALERAKNWID